MSESSSCTASSYGHCFFVYLFHWGRGGFLATSVCIIWGLIYIFLMTTDAEHFHVLIGHLYMSNSFAKCVFKIFGQFFNGAVCLFIIELHELLRCAAYKYSVRYVRVVWEKKQPEIPLFFKYFSNIFS